MAGKICLVTGATAGIGEVTARELARSGATVVGVGRQANRCAESAQRIRQATGNSNVEFLVADLSVQEHIHRLADEFKSKYGRLDVLVNNAGAYFATRQLSADGIEMTMALNHLNYFLLTHLLLDVLKAAGSARVVNVSSDAHRMAKMDFDDIEGQRRYSGWRMYGQSKLANILFTRELARRLQGAPITANALHPGFVATRFGHNNGGLASLAMKALQKIAALTPEQGAQTSLYLATSPDVAGMSGCYFTNCRPVAPSVTAQDDEAAARLWDWSLAKTGLKDGGFVSPSIELQSAF
ncbi:MAG: SDR family oxidoreductase [Anaerolineae bacterium]|nr:SDR family oxidoreductase [Thermoflexales bacterium]MDW8407517.1 SDR family oxidoreductase [Anaerolineae bacterium]